VAQLVGFGCSPLAVKGSKKRFLALLTRGMKLSRIHLPENDSNLGWQTAGWFEADRDRDN
jgi:hypothetical protein